MSTTNPVTPEAVMEEIKPLHPVIYKAIEYGVESTRNYFEGLERQINASLAPCLVRYHAMVFLDDSDDSRVSYIREELGSNGLLLKYPAENPKYIIRIWKADNGVLPAPGRSRIRQQFVHQPYLPFFLDDGDLMVPLHLVVTWDVDARFSLSEVRLVCPKGGGGKYEAGQEHWSIGIPHPIASIETVTDFDGETEDINFESIDKKTGTEDE